MTAAGTPASAGPGRHGTWVEVIVGKVGRAHGLAGEVFVEVRTDEPKRRFAAGTSFATPRGRLSVDSTRWQGRRLLVKFAEVGDRSAAEALRGVELSLGVPADERPDDPEEFYDHQLVGLSAYPRQGDRIGEITEVLHLPAQDVLVLQRPDGHTALLPFVREVIPMVDLTAGRVTVTDDAGLLAADIADVAAEQDPDASSVEGGNDAHRHHLDLS